MKHNTVGCPEGNCWYSEEKYGEERIGDSFGNNWLNDSYENFNEISFGAMEILQPKVTEKL